MSYRPVKDCASCPKLGLKTDGVVMVLHRVESFRVLNNPCSHKWLKYPSGAYALLLFNYCQKPCDILASVSQVHESDKGAKS